MKILRLLLTAALAVLISTAICGCDDGNSSVSPVPAGENLGRVIIPLPKNYAGNARSVGLESAQNYTNFYEALFIKDDVTLSVTAEEGVDQIEINIAEGVYTILLIAGCKSSLATPLILASGYVEGQDIHVGENVITITLKPIDVDITAPDSVTQNESFEVKIEVDTRNPLIDLTTFSLPLYLDSLSTKFDSVDIVKNENFYTWTYTVTAPQSIPKNGMMLYISSSVKLLGEKTWYLGYYIDSGTNFKGIKDFYKKIIPVTADTNLPKVSLVIEWAN
ncbi:MAG: hypothetical protein LBG05_07440 [Treponema sp.]|jgi:hypothetical protein|nr:hypothetical protein [Treponema sp.]